MKSTMRSPVSEPSPSEADWDPVVDRAERRRKFLGKLFAAPLLAYGLAAFFRLLAWDASVVLAQLNAFSFWLYLPAYLLGALCLLLRLTPHFLGYLLLSAFHVFLIWPQVVGVVAPSEPQSRSSSLRVASVNVYGGNFDQESIAAELLASRADLILIQELTPRWALRFGQADFLSAYPERCQIVREDYFGLGIFSRLPFSCEEKQLLNYPAQRAVIQFPGAATIEVLNVHTMPPIDVELFLEWRDMLQGAFHLSQQRRHPLILGGDFNLTPFHALYRSAQKDFGLSSAHDLVGRSSATTWPNGTGFLPPIRLDHLFLSPELEALQVSEGVGKGSDHKPVFAELSLLSQGPRAHP